MLKKIRVARKTPLLIDNGLPQSCGYFFKKIRFSITDVPYVKFLFKNFWSGPLQKPFR